MSFYGWNIYLGRKYVEKPIVNIFFLLGFNYFMIKSWGTRKVTILTLIGNYFLISILIESYFGLPKFIEDFNALFMFGIGMVGTYILWRKNKVGDTNWLWKKGLELNTHSGSFDFYIRIIILIVFLIYKVLWYYLAC